VPWHCPSPIRLVGAPLAGDFPSGNALPSPFFALALDQYVSALDPERGPRIFVACRSSSSGGAGSKKEDFPWLMTDLKAAGAGGNRNPVVAERTVTDSNPEALAGIATMIATSAASLNGQATKSPAGSAMTKPIAGVEKTCVTGLMKTAGEGRAAS